MPVYLVILRFYQDGEPVGTFERRVDAPTSGAARAQVVQAAHQEDRVPPTSTYGSEVTLLPEDHL